jgi:predicted secreted protein
MQGIILALATALWLTTAVTAHALTPTQSAASAAKARTDAQVRARVEAEAKARSDAQASARVKVEAAIKAQKKAAVEVFLRSQVTAKANAKPLYMLANVPRQGPAGQVRAAARAPLGLHPTAHHHHQGGTGAHPAHHASGHGR